VFLCFGLVDNESHVTDIMTGPLQLCDKVGFEKREFVVPSARSDLDREYPLVDLADPGSGRDARPDNRSPFQSRDGRA
jgi:hypothetical protein